MESSFDLEEQHTRIYIGNVLLKGDITLRAGTYFTALHINILNGNVLPNNSRDVLDPIEDILMLRRVIQNERKNRTNSRPRNPNAVRLLVYILD